MRDLAWWLGVVVGALIVAGGCKPEAPPADDDDDDVTDDDDDGTPSSDPLTIAIDSPADGTIGTASSILVEGTVSGAHPIVVVNGISADVDGGRFSASVPVDPGRPLTPLLAEAVDDSGWVRDRRTYLYGDAVPSSSAVTDGLAIRLTDRGLDGLESYVLTLLSTEQIADLVLAANPLYQGEVLWTPIEINATSASIGGIEADLDAASSGLLVDASLTDVLIDIDVDADWAGLWPGTVSVSSADVIGRAELSAVGGLLVVEFPELAVTLHDLTIDFEDIWDALEGVITGIVQGFLEDMVVDMLREQVTAAIDDLLGSLADGFAVGPVTVGLAFADALHDADGVVLVLDLSFGGGPGDGIDSRVATPGPLPSMIGVSTPHGDPYGAQLVVDDDALNAIGIALVSSGLLHQTLAGELPTEPPLPLTAGILAPMFPSLDGVLDEDEPLTIQTAPSVPLIGVPGVPPGGAIDYHLGGFLVEIAGDLDGDGGAEPIYHVVLDGRLALGIDEGNLDVGAEGLVATLIWSALPADKTEGSGLAALLELAVGLMVGDLVSGLTEMIPGMELVPLEADVAGAEEEHAAVYTDLVPATP